MRTEANKRRGREEVEGAAFLRRWWWWWRKGEFCLQPLFLPWTHLHKYTEDQTGRDRQEREYLKVEGEKKPSVWESKTGKQWAEHSREAEEQSAPCTQQSERGSRGTKKKSRAGVTKTGKGGRRASWTWGCVWLLCGFYSSSVSPRLSWGDFGLQGRKVRAAADTNRSFKCIQLFTFVFFLQTDCQVYYLTKLSDWDLHV